MKFIGAKFLTLFGFLTMSAHSLGAFHLWTINEVFSNADGSIQYIELFSSTAGQQFLVNHDITIVKGDGMGETYTFPSNTDSPTNDKHLLLATRDFEAVTGISPDFLIPTGFIPSDAFSLNFANVDEVDLQGLPRSGSQSLGGDGVISELSPTTFAGVLAEIPSVAISFDGETGVLNIAHVSVEGQGAYSASLEVVSSDPLAFDLVDATFLSDRESHDLARFSSATGELILPSVLVGESRYSATLMIDAEAPGLRFILTGAELLE